MPDPAYTQIHNFRAVDESLVTGGQPTVPQLESLAQAGFTAVINLALHDQPRYSLPDETGTVTGLGMKYVHIPVQFEAPTEAQLLAFFDAMDAQRGGKVLVHCAANMRVTAFLGLYWRIRLGWTDEKAFQLMSTVWHPNDVWGDFMTAMIEKHGSRQT